jgi:hypothetical protein
MKKLSLVVMQVLFLFPSLIYAGDRPKEFRGLAWGTNIAKVQGLILQHEHIPPNLPPDISKMIENDLKAKEKRGEKTYTRPLDSLKIGGGEVDVIKYVFQNDQLAKIIMRFRYYEQYLNFKSLFLNLYGAPDREENKLGLEHSWYANNDDEADVTLFFTDRDGVKAGAVVMEWKASSKKEAGL